MDENKNQIEKPKPLRNNAYKAIRRKGEEYYKTVTKLLNGIKHDDIVTGKTREEVLEKEKAWRASVMEKNEMPEREVKIPSQEFQLVLPELGGFSVVCIGASRSGKTTVLKHLVKEYMDKKLLFLTSFNDHAAIYKDLPKKTIISSSFHPELLKDFHTLQHESANKYKACFIYDDAIGHELKNSSQITKLLTIYRNADMSSIFSAQSPTLVSPAGRSNANYILLFKLNSASDVEMTIKDFLLAYFPAKMTMNEKIHWYTEKTQDHHFICIDNINNTICLCKLSASQV